MLTDEVKKKTDENSLKFNLLAGDIQHIMLLHEDQIEASNAVAKYVTEMVEGEIKKYIDWHYGDGSDGVLPKILHISKKEAMKNIAALKSKAFSNYKQYLLEKKGNL